MNLLPFVLMSLPLASYSETESCLEAYKTLVLSDPGQLVKMIYFSGRNLNDFGDQFACEKLKESRFLVFIAKVGILDIGLGICAPQSCSAKDLLVQSKELMEILFQKYPISKTFIKSESFQVIDVKDYDSEPLNWPAKMSLIFILSLLILVTLGTVAEYFSYSSPLLHCFSLLSNVPKLLSPPPTHSSLQVFNGIRVISMLLICLGHNYSFSFTGPVVNPARAFSIFQEFWSHLAFISFYMVDVFFVISGFLVAYLVIAELQKHQGRQNWFLFIFHRLVRICPIYFIVLMIYINLLRFMGSGALWPLFWTTSQEYCHYWWTNLLFISNLYPPNQTSCMGWSWFISNDMQFHFVSPFLLLLHYKNKRFGYLSLFLLILANFLSTFIEALLNDYNPGVIYGVANREQFIHNYQRPYNRIGPYLLGMLFGFVYRGYVDHLNSSEKKEIETDGLLHSQHKCKVTQIEVIVTDWVHNKKFRFMAVGFASVFLVVFPFFTYNFDNNGPEYWSVGWKALYLASEHIGFSAVFIVWVMPMTEGYGGKVNRFLGSGFFGVLAKVSFSFYLVHPGVILFYVYNRGNSVFISHFNYFYEWPSTVMYSLVLAVGLSLCIESPVLRLEKYFFDSENVSKHN